MSAIDIGYKMDALSLNVGLFQTDLTDDWTSVVVKFNTGSGTAKLQLEDNGTNSQTVVGYDHKMSKKTSVYAELSTGDFTADEQTNVGIHINF